MNNLTKHETVWLQAFTAATTCHLQAANYALEAFRVTFPPSPPPQKETVSGVEQVSCAHRLVRSDCVMCPPVEPAKLDGVYVTREMLAKAWNSLDHSYLTTAENSSLFKRLVKGLGLGHDQS